MTVLLTMMATTMMMIATTKLIDKDNMSHDDQKRHYAHRPISEHVYGNLALYDMIATRKDDSKDAGTANQTMGSFNIYFTGKHIVSGTASQTHDAARHDQPTLSLLSMGMADSVTGTVRQVNDEQERQNTYILMNMAERKYLAHGIRRIASGAYT